MLKNAYKNAIDKYVPDSALIESTKNAMRNELGALNSDKSDVIALVSQPSAKITFWQKYGKLAAGAACIALVIGTAVGVSAYLGRDDITNKQDSFASSGHHAFDGDAANDGDDSVQMEITQTTTSVTTAATSRADNIHTQIQTSVASTTTSAATTSAVTTQATEQTTKASQTTQPVQTTRPAQTTQPMQTTKPVETTSTTQTETQAQTAKTTTSATVTTSAITTTTTTADTDAQTTTAVTPPQDFDGEHRPHFGYYDPQYDPNFREDFGGGFGEEFLFEHQGVFYYFDMHKSDKVKVDIEGQEFTLRQALDDKIIMPEDLLAFEGFICKGYYNDDKNAEPIDIHPEYEDQMQQQGGFMQNQEGNPANGQSGQNGLNPAQSNENIAQIPQE